MAHLKASLSLIGYFIILYSCIKYPSIILPFFLVASGIILAILLYNELYKFFKNK